MIHRFQPSIYYHTYGPNTPALKVKPGDIVIAPTVDAGRIDHTGTKISPKMSQRSPDTVYSGGNPLTGPFYVEGAEPGDTLTVKIQRIKLTRSSAWSGNMANFGSLTEESSGRKLLLNDPLPPRRYEWTLDISTMTGSTTLGNGRTMVVPLNPFIGSIGVAPSLGRVAKSGDPGNYGGNMDSPDIHEGVELQLPVSVRGGLLVFGDIHAAQGDGEICGSALETSAELSLKLGILKKTIEWPRIIDDDWIMVAGSGRPLMEAYKIAHIELIRWLVDEYGYEKLDALQMVSQVGRCKIANTVNSSYTIVAKFPKMYL